MIKVSVLYANTDGMRFDMDYYVNRHMPMVQGLLGDVLRRYEIEEGISGPAPGSAPAYRAAVHMYFDSVEAFQTAFAPHGKAIMKDVANYTDATPLTQVSKIRVG